VGVFAGAFTFGTLLQLSNSIENYDYISRLLSIAFVLFATSLFLAIAIQILLRRDVSTQPPSQRKAKLFVFHIGLVSGLLIAGFVVLNLVLMKIGQNAVGVTGIVLLCLIAAWIGVVWYAESSEMLEDKTADKQKPIQSQHGASKGGTETQVVATASV
jgi:uncharacterized membrane protein YfcA